jgi:segregation and condensation protein B
VSSDTGDDIVDLRSAPPLADEDEAAGPLAALVGGPGLRAALEAVLLVVDEPVADVTLAQVLERPRGEVVETLHELAREYEDQGRGFELRQVAGGWRFYTRADCAAVVERFVLDGQQARLTQAALETLAVVAYRQPVSRGRIAGIRGVNVDGVVRTLLNRGLIAEAGTEADTHALLYRTTPLFLERLGLSGVEELPSLAPFLPELESLDDPDVSMSTLELEDMSHE